MKLIKLSILILFLLLLAYPANAATVDLVRSTVECTDNVDQGAILEFVWNTPDLSNEEVRYLIKDIPSEFDVDATTVQITTNMGAFDKVIKFSKIALKSTTALNGNLEVKIKITIPSDCPENTYTLKLSEMVGSESDMLNPSSIGITVQKSSTNPPSVTVLYPNGGESISVGTQVQVSAYATDDTAVMSVTFYYSSNGGSNWNSIGAGTRASGTNKDGVWNRTWNTNGLSAGTNYLIKAVASDGTLTREDQSDSKFSLTSSKVIRVPVDYLTIQAAVDAARVGNTIIVRDGIYTENIDVNKPHLTIRSENGAGATIVQAANSNDKAFEVTADYVSVSGFTFKGANYTEKAGIYLTNANYCNVSDNTAYANYVGIYLWKSNNNTVIKNTLCTNDNAGLRSYHSSGNVITRNNVSRNYWNGIVIDGAYNILSDNAASSNSYSSILVSTGSNNIICNNDIRSNKYYGICFSSLWDSCNNIIYLNSFVDNSANYYSNNVTNIWSSLSKITYTYNGNTYTSHLGNYWDDYSGRDVNGDGIGDTAYSINLDKDYYPLMQPWENHFKSLEEKIFDTCSPANPYPSISGTHTGTITPNQDITVQKLYTYPCAGTGGHTEFVRIYGNGLDESASWTGYGEDWDTITFDSSFTLEVGKTYNYVIKTGSYPQIHHMPALKTENGWINCTSFVDANGKEHKDWIPAIRLFS